MAKNKVEEPSGSTWVTITLVSAVISSGIVFRLIGDIIKSSDQGPVEPSPQVILIPEPRLEITGPVNTPSLIDFSNPQDEVKSEYEEYLEYINNAISKLDGLSGDTHITFPIGTNYPIAIGTASTDSKKFQVIGYSDKTNPDRIIGITVNDVLSMVESRHNIFYKELSDRSESQVETINLVVVNLETNERMRIPLVRVSDVFRDAINSILMDEFNIGKV